MSALLQPLLVAFQLALAPPGLAAPTAAPAPAATTPAAAPPAVDLAPLRAATDRASGELAAARRARAERRAIKQRLAVAYDAELAAVDRLKRGRASWRRDRQVAAAKAAAEASARRLAGLDREVGGLEGAVASAERRLLAALDRELAAGSGRRDALLAQRRGLAAARPPAKKILLPDAALDTLADPAVLAEQIALIERAERELAREQRLLAGREERYGRMARLREQRDRAAELSRPDDEAVRREPGRPRGERAEAGSEGAPADDAGGDSDFGGAEGESPGTGGVDTGGEPPAVDEGAAFEASSVALADVVDSVTADALRRAGRSSDPRARREAAARARRQVEVLLERLRASRSTIERHLRKLDGE